MREQPQHRSLNCRALGLSACVVAMLSGCGGGSNTAAESTAAGFEVASATTTLQLDDVALPDAAAAQLARPAFHAAPVLLNAPDDTDAVDPAASARAGPRIQSIPPQFAGLSSQRLTVQALESAGRVTALAAHGVTADGAATPAASGGAAATYSPAQIRAAYALPALPATGAALTAVQAAQLGAGQTIYIVDAQHDPNVAAELAAFNQKFGLPGCTARAISASAALPLAAPSSTSACELAVVYATANGTMTGSAPPYDAGWATEITLDVQWAHATAPLARIVLIEAADASLNGLLGAVKLANAMGPGVVSMSFGGSEGNWTTSVDSAFAGAGMTYLAATGDSGAEVSWPAVSANVVAVGGTSLAYSGTGSRSETAWSGTGGGISLYVANPAYQTAAVPGLGSVAHRAVADVSFNADPYTGQYVAVMTPGSSAVSWLSIGGTSLSTPQWAGLIAVANASRAQSSKPALGAPHAVLYGQIGAVPGTYAGAFADIVKGSDGSCATCSAKAGYDTPTGLGTPNAGSLLAALNGAAAPVAAPVVTGASIAGQVGTALSFMVSATAPNPLTYSLVGAPSGMAVSASGAVTWAAPAAGSYAVTAVAKDSKTGLSGQALYSVSIAAQTPPMVAGAAVSGRPGVAFSYQLAVNAPDAVAYSLTGAPAGMVVSTGGVLGWPSPVVGTYDVTVSARDARTGLTGQGLIVVKIASAGPVITAPAVSGIVGKPATVTIAVADPGATSLRVSISGAPMGMTFSMSGMVVTAVWASPVQGSYPLSVAVVDSAGLTATTTVPVTIAAK